MRACERPGALESGEAKSVKGRRIGKGRDRVPVGGALSIARGRARGEKEGFNFCKLPVTTLVRGGGVQKGNMEYGKEEE